MIDTLNIGKYIYTVLSTDSTLKSLLGSTQSVSKIYPLVADNDVKYPFIVYRRVSLSSNSCKDGYYEDDAVIELVIVTDSYKSGIDISTRVRELLEVQDVTYDDMRIYSTTLSFASEEYVNNAFVQKMQFNININ